MGFLRRIAGILGFSRDGAHDAAAAGDGEEEEEEEEEEDDRTAKEALSRRKGFSVQVPVAVDRPGFGPALVPCGIGEGGVQGFRWHARRLRIDEDGDVADEFLDEVCPETSPPGNVAAGTQPKFEVKYRTRPAIVKKQTISMDGNLHHNVEHHGRLQWV